MKFETSYEKVERRNPTYKAGDVLQTIGEKEEDRDFMVVTEDASEDDKEISGTIIKPGRSFPFGQYSDGWPAEEWELAPLGLVITITC